MPTATDRVALVTGANKGIGFEIARQLGRTGHRVLLGCRDEGRGAAATASLASKGVDTVFVPIDVTDAAAIAAAARDIDTRFGRLDVLVNNAGIAGGGDGPPGQAKLDAVRRIFDTNFFGALAVTQAMLPLLRKSPSARVVNVSSGLGSLTHHSNPEWDFAGWMPMGYSASKAALNMLTVLLATEMADTGIKVNAADPGFTATDLNDHQGHQTIPQGAEAAVRLALLPDDGPTGGFFSAAGREPW